MKKIIISLMTFVTTFLLMSINVDAKNEIQIAPKLFNLLFYELENTKDENLEEWFYKYQTFANKFDPDRDTVECVFSDEEVQLMWQVIETETYDASFIQKINVANVLLNRLQSANYDYKNMIEVITDENQFTYYRTNITQSTKDALAFAFEVKDTTDGCIAFRSDVKVDDWNSWEYAMYDGAHWFYKIKEE